MDTTQLANALRQDLANAAELGGPEVKAAAQLLLLALDSSLRLTLMDALTQAAAEINAALPGVTISVRLQGREPVFSVEGAPAAPQPGESYQDDDAEATARITLRIPETLKSRAEAVAARRGQSLNTWLIGAVRAAIPDRPQGNGESFHKAPGRMKGWVR